MPISRVPNSEPLPGYRLIAPLGSGGFGEVWKCEAPGGLIKAIKFVYGNLNTLDNEAVRAAQEQNALERVKAVRHPFILSIERIEIVEGELIIVTELADKSMYDRLVECQSAGLPGIPRDEVLSGLRDAAEALDLMNFQHDLQHLDIKPRNLFLVSNHVKVADFGLVKNLEQMNATPGNLGLLGGVTPLYAAPETFRGIISRHSDQYSLAIVFQELLTGQRPFNGKNPRQLAVQHCQEPPDLTALPEADRPIVARALSKNPQHRFPSCLSFVRALISGQIPEQRPVATSVRLGLPPRLLGFPDLLEDFMLSPAESSPASPVAGRGDAASMDKTGVFTVSPQDQEICFAPSLSPEEACRLSVTVAQPRGGSLRPTLVIGLGGFGRVALQALRCRFTDRFGSLAKLGLLRFLYLDTDQRELQQALRGPPEHALSSSELCHLPMQPMAHYRRNKALLEQISSWLPVEKLYNMPRSLETNGVRALGRLAFAESYHRLAARLRREIQLICSPDAIDHSVNLTGLALRSDSPQVYVIAAAGGGTGSGIILDLGYALRKILVDQGQTDPDVIALLMCGAPSDPATPLQEQGNLYATLTEINHFSDSSVTFVAEYGPHGPRLQDAGAPFQAVYLLRMNHRSPEGIKESACRLASYVFHDLSTPLGSRLAASRLAQRLGSSGPFRSFGAYAVWYPRGLLLRVAARRACYRLIDEWRYGRQRQNWWPELSGSCARATASSGAAPPTAADGGRARLSSHDFCLQSDPERKAAIALVCDRVLADPHWRGEALRQRLEEAAAATLDGTPHAALTHFLLGLETQIDSGVAREDPAGWCQQAVERVREWVGSGLSAVEETSEWRKSRLHRTFDLAVQKAADDLIEGLARPAQEFFNTPGYRLAAAEAALAYLIERCHQRIEEFEPAVKEQVRQTEQSWGQVEEAIEACLYPGSFFLFAGSRIRKLLRTFLDRLTSYARQRLAEELHRSIQSLFKALAGRLHDLMRDMSFCGQRLTHLAENLIVPAEAADPLSGTVVDLETGPPLQLPASSSQMLGEAARSLASRVVLPEGATDLDLAATRFLDQVSEDIWQQLDEHLQQTVLEPPGGLYRICITSSDLAKSLGIPLLENAAEFLGRHLPTTDVCEAEMSSAETLQIDLAAQVKAYYHLAAPLIRSSQAGKEQAYLLVPASEAGEKLANLARQAVPELQTVCTASLTDLLFCREQTNLAADDLQRILSTCAAAYQEAASMLHTSPHVRSDIVDWVPLAPGV